MRPIAAGAMIRTQPPPGGKQVIGSNEAAGQASGSAAYRAGTAVAALTSLLTVWTTVVRDDGNGIGFFMLVMAAAVGGFAARFRPAGMARTMVGVAIMQVLLGLLIATEPVIASLPGGQSRALLSCGVFAVLWLISAAFFRSAGKGGG
jgi:hypothetical protein